MENEIIESPDLWAIVNTTTLELLYLSLVEVVAVENEILILMKEDEFTCSQENCYYDLETNTFYNKYDDN